MAKKRDVYLMSNGQPCTEGSVSEISNGLLEKPYLVPWAAKVTVQALGGREIFPGDTDEPGLWQPGKAYEKWYIAGALQEAKGAPRRKKDTAGDIGTRIHKIVGAYVEGQLMPDDVRLDDEKRGLENFIKVTKDWKWHGSEVTVINEWIECGCGKYCIQLWEPGMEGKNCISCKQPLRLCGYGGTADGLAEIVTSGMMILPDFKTSNQIAATYSVQCMMYAEGTPVGDAAHLKELWKLIKETRILHFDKELLTWEVLERSIDEHRPYLQHFIGCNRWRKRFDKPSYSTAGEKTVIITPGNVSIDSSASPVFEPSAPAPSIFIG